MESWILILYLNLDLLALDSVRLLHPLHDLRLRVAHLRPHRRRGHAAAVAVGVVNLDLESRNLSIFNPLFFL